MIGMRAHDVPCGDIAELSDRLAKQNMYTVQLALNKSVQNINLSAGSFSPGAARYIKGELDRNGISISVLGCYINPVEPDPIKREEQLARFREHALFCKYLGADMIGTETGSLSPDGLYCPENHSEENYQDFLCTMRQLAEYCAKIGVCIGIEAVTFFTIHSPEVTYRMLCDLNMPNILIILDPSNLLDETNYRNQREVFDRAFSLYKDRIAVVHLKDFVIRNGKKEYVYPTEGMLDYPYLFSLLKKHKPNITMLLEEVPESEVARIGERVKKVFDQA